MINFCPYFQGVWGRWFWGPFCYTYGSAHHHNFPFVMAPGRGIENRGVLWREEDGGRMGRLSIGFNLFMAIQLVEKHPLTNKTY